MFEPANDNSSCLVLSGSLSRLNRTLFLMFIDSAPAVPARQQQAFTHLSPSAFIVPNQ
jgi:hypothetical protein